MPNTLNTKRNCITLIEMMVAVLIIGVLLSGASLNLGSILPQRKMESAVSALGSLYRLACNKAISKGEEQTLLLDLSTSRVILQNGTGQLSKAILPKEIRIAQVISRDEHWLPPGELSVGIAPTGPNVDLILHLEMDPDHEFSVIFDSLQPNPRWVVGHAEFEEELDIARF